MKGVTLEFGITIAGPSYGPKVFAFAMPTADKTADRPNEAGNSILKKSRWFLLPVDISVKNALDLHDIAPRLVENQPAVEGRGHDQETHTFQGPMFEARPNPHLRELRQPVESLKSRIQKIPGRLLVVGGDEISRGDQVFIRLR